MSRRKRLWTQPPPRTVRREGSALAGYAVLTVLIAVAYLLVRVVTS